MPLWSIQNPINFSSYGDRTFEAIKKGCIDEIALIYEHLNFLKDNSVAYANVALKGIADDEASLPASAEVGDIWAVPGEYQTLFVWNGDSWVNLAIEQPPEASIDEAGLVQLGTIDGAMGTDPSLTKVINGPVLSAFKNLQGFGVPPGAIVIWYNTLATIPRGYFVCDGTNGTPDLRSKFVRQVTSDTNIGQSGGTNTVSVPQSTLPSHTHTIKASASAPSHSHSLSGTTITYSGSHSHSSGSKSGTTSSNGGHSHLGNAVWNPKSQNANSGTLTISTCKEVYKASNSAGSHSHSGANADGSISNASVSHTHTLSGNTGYVNAASGSFSGTTGSAQEGQNTILDIIPVYKEVIYIMKGLV